MDSEIKLLTTGKLNNAIFKITDVHLYCAGILGRVVCLCIRMRGKKTEASTSTISVLLEL